MHIKQITISNFRSFRQQPEIHPFAATTNCVVGRNGSGKSNLFDAVQFVLLAPRFATLRSVRIPSQESPLRCISVVVSHRESMSRAFPLLSTCRKNAKHYSTKAAEALPSTLLSKWYLTIPTIDSLWNIRMKLSCDARWAARRTSFSCSANEPPNKKSSPCWKVLALASPIPTLWSNKERFSLFA